MKLKAAKKIAHEFVLDYLSPLDVVTKPMFGCQGVYVGDKIVFILRSRADHPEANGVWLATDAEHHASLRKLFPNMCSIAILSDGKSETKWQMLPESADDFEPSAIKACQLVVAGDGRIGRIPKPKKKKAVKLK